jgi:hypothetical protein
VEFARVALVFLVSLPLRSQEPGRRVDGDETVRREVEPVVRRIYDAGRDPVFLLMKSGVPGFKRSKYAEVAAYVADGELCRIVASTWLPRGKYSVEYYLRQGTLLQVYETLVFDEKEAPARVWRNFMHLPAWERRIYRNGSGGEFVETTGIGEENVPNWEQKLSALDSLRALVEQKRSASGRAR